MERTEVTLTPDQLDRLCEKAKSCGLEIRVRPNGSIVMRPDSKPTKALTAKERMRRMRERKIIEQVVTNAVTAEPGTVTPVTDVTQNPASPLSPSTPPPIAHAHADALVREEPPHKRIGWTPETGWTGWNDDDFANLRKAYPACDIARQLSAADLWLRANPRKSKKKNIFRFATNWLERQQERGGDETSKTPKNGTPNRTTHAPGNLAVFRDARDREDTSTKTGRLF